MSDEYDEMRKEILKRWETLSAEDIHKQEAEKEAEKKAQTDRVRRKQEPKRLAELHAKERQVKKDRKPQTGAKIIHFTWTKQQEINVMWNEMKHLEHCIDMLINADKDRLGADSYLRMLREQMLEMVDAIDETIGEDKG